VSRLTIDREIDLLAEAGLVSIERLGRTRMISAAVTSPLFAPMRELIEKTLGVEARLRQALAGLPGVEAAAVFGSWASGTAAADSDIDVLVVGDVDYERLVAALHQVGGALGRELNLMALTRDELTERLRDETGVMGL
jgi:predicted nucleotidyltransferase